MLSKSSRDNPSCFQSGGVVGAFGSTPVAWRQVTTARIIDEESGNDAPVKYGWGDVAFQTSRNLGELREVKFLGILEGTHSGRMGMISTQ